MCAQSALLFIYSAVRWPLELHPLACHLTYLQAKVDVLLALEFPFPLAAWLSCFIYPTCYVTSESGSSSVSFNSLWLSTNITTPSRNHQVEISLQNHDKVQWSVFDMEIRWSWTYGNTHNAPDTTGSRSASLSLSSRSSGTQVWL